MQYCEFVMLEHFDGGHVSCTSNSPHISNRSKILPRRESNPGYARDRRVS